MAAECIELPPWDKLEELLCVVALSLKTSAIVRFDLLVLNFGDDDDLDSQVLLVIDLLLWCNDDNDADADADVVDDDDVDVDDDEEDEELAEVALTDAAAVTILLVVVVDEVLDTSESAVSSLLKSGGGVAYIDAAIFVITAKD